MKNYRSNVIMRKLNLKVSILFLICLILLSVSAEATEKEPIRVACIGNSITYGAGLQNPFRDSYPGVLEQLLGTGYDVRNFGISGRTTLQKGDRPYVRERLYVEALDFAPDIVTIKLGTNDTKPWNWVHKGEFEHDLSELVRSFQTLETRPRVILCLPVPAPEGGKSINEETLVRDVIPSIRRVAHRSGAEVLDLHEALKPYYPRCFPDGVHPDAEGSRAIAQTLYACITQQPAPQVAALGAFPGKKSVWNGYERYDFVCAGREAIVVVPQKAAPGKPWIWRPAFFGAFPSVDLALLKEGFHVAYYDLTHLYGSPRAMRLGDVFYERMVQRFGLSSKVTLEGFSRGGLAALNWAAHRPDRVACVYVDAPVCDLSSWPGRERSNLWADMLEEWDVTDGEVTPDFKGNAFHSLPALAKHKIPIIAVCGDSDKVVPYQDNMRRLRDRYASMGGVVEVILKPGCDHHPHSLEQPEAVVDFIKRYQNGEAKYRHIMRRGTLANAFSKFEGEKKGTVAFLGGSITEMKGWHNMIMEDLKQRFPETTFTFIEAGISSTGSTPHAFRLESDVLQKGMPDLMFVEAVVNDHTNGFGPVEQVRGMEGIVRHALELNPVMDIVMLHFIYDPFIGMAEAGRRPDVVLNHERVANHYGLSSIDLIQDIFARMKDGQFTWKEFGGTHPAWVGHKYYAAAINALFDAEQQDRTEWKTEPHSWPEKPLDAFSYDKGCFVGIDQATHLKGFRIENDWTPQENSEASVDWAVQTQVVKTRKNFVHVPMLVADKAGASFRLEFEGRAIGLFGVSGPSAGVLEYSVDGSDWKRVDTHTKWSDGVYLPWVFMLEDELPAGKHMLKLRMAKGRRTGCWIRNFVVNR